jgi:HlyD family secretion protein
VIRTLLGIWRVLDRSQQRRLALLQLLAVIMAFCTLGGVAAVLPFFTVLAEPQSLKDIPLLNALYQQLHFAHERDFVAALGLGFVGIVLLSNAVNLIGYLAMNRFAFLVGNDLQVILFDEYLHRSYQFHARTNSATLSSKVIYETGRVTSGLLQSGFALLTNFIAIVSIVASAIFVNPLIAICAIAGLGASYVLIYVLARRRLLKNGLIESRLVAERARIVNESFGAIKEVLVLQRQDFFIAGFARACRSISRTLADNFAISQSPRHILESLVIGGLAAVAVLLSRRGSGIGPWLAQLTFVGFAAYRLLPALQQVFAALVRIRADRPAFDSIADDLRLARARRIGTRARVIDRSWRGRPRDELRLHAVTFRYDHDRPDVLRDISLSLPARTTIGLVGANGSGKTTLADLIAGLLIPQSGHIEIDGIVLDESNRLQWQSIIAYVPQQIFLLDASVAENIALGVAAAEIDRHRMLRAARLAQLDECIADLPGGYAETLGERGVRLSGGQRQRIGIARALYRDASLLILDEAMNAVDGLIEQELMSTLDALHGELTIIVIAHRLSSVRGCDLIFELAGGTVLNSGTYGQLLRKSDRFRRMIGHPEKL